MDRQRALAAMAGEGHGRRARSLSNLTSPSSLPHHPSPSSFPPGYIDLPTALRLYANHRPVGGGVSAADLSKALSTVATHIKARERDQKGASGTGAGGGGLDSGRDSRGRETREGGFTGRAGSARRGGASSAASTTNTLLPVGVTGAGDPTIEWGPLTRLLQARGERMSAAELKTCLTALLGPPGGSGGRKDEEDEEEDEDSIVGSGGGESHFADYTELHAMRDIAGKVLGFELHDNTQAGGASGTPGAERPSSAT